jgi:arylsulfatase A-like enzyme
MDKPNILFLFTDDQRYRTFGMNNPSIITPNLDRLASEGCFFDQAFIPGGSCPAVCMPSRAMLHTGRSLFSIEEEGQSIPEDHITIGEHLDRHGYDTWGTGKWHNGTESFTRSFRKGAEVFFGGMDDHWNVPVCQFHPDGNYPEPVEHPWDPGTGTTMKIPKRFDRIAREAHSTDLFADRAVEYLESRSSESPFFMYVSFMAPHDPRTMPKRFLNLYNPQSIELPPNFRPEHSFDNGELDVRDEHLAPLPRTENDIRKHLAEYYAMISHLDTAIGRVLSALKSTGEYENTVIILAGDNGLALGSHGLMGKQNLYDHSVHVPLVIAGPNIIGGRRTDAACYLYDLFPTICDMADCPIPESAEGESLSDILLDKSETCRESLFFAYRGLQRGIQLDWWKLISYRVGSDFRIQLFDLNADPWELNDLSGDFRERDRVKIMTQMLLDQMKSAKDPFLPDWEEELGRLYSSR